MATHGDCVQTVLLDMYPCVKQSTALFTHIIGLGVLHVVHSTTCHCVYTLQSIPSVGVHIIVTHPSLCVCVCVCVCIGVSIFSDMWLRRKESTTSSSVSSTQVSSVTSLWVTLLLHNSQYPVCSTLTHIVSASVSMKFKLPLTRYEMEYTV